MDGAEQEPWDPFSETALADNDFESGTLDHDQQMSPEDLEDDIVDGEPQAQQPLPPASQQVVQQLLSMVNALEARNKELQERQESAAAGHQSGNA